MFLSFKAHTKLFVHLCALKCKGNMVGCVFRCASKDKDKDNDNDEDKDNDKKASSASIGTIFLLVQIFPLVYNEK